MSAKQDRQNLAKFLEQTEVLFDGSVYKLTPKEKAQLQDALEAAFWDAKERNKRKPGKKMK